MRKRIFRSTAILVTLAILVTFVTAFFFMYNKLEENMTERVDNEVDYLAKAVDELGGTSLETGLADGVTGRITLVDAVGNVLYDSCEDAAEMENHASRPEIAQAMKEGRGSASRYSTTYAKRSYYAAVRLDNGQILRVGDTIDSVYGTLFPGVFMLLLPLVLLLILSFYLIDRTTKRMMEPLEAIDLDHPLENVAYDELVPFLRRIADQNEALKEQVQERNKQQQEYVAITENMKDGLIVTSRHHVLSINRAAQRIFEIKPEECMGQNIIVVNRNQKLKEVVDGALAGKDMVKHMTIDDVTYELHGNPVIQDGTNTGVVIFIMDVTQKKQLENMRQEFSANVSHELKTPLMSISGYAELIEHGMSGENTERFASEIHKNAARLLTLINDIIQLSQLDGGKKDVEYRDLDLFPLARECVDMLQMNAQKQNVTIRVQGGEAPVFADKQLMEELIYNLCDNAIRYNKKDGTVTVTTGIENGHTFLSVKDTGIGISAEHQERVFERFYRVDKSRSKATGGTGLGLAIVKHIVAQHGAKLTLESEQGKGTEICVEFSEALKQHEIETAKQRQEVHAERSENGSSD